MDSAFFAYGDKTKEFLIKRSIYLIEYLKNKCDVIILACNTLSIIALPFLKLIYNNVYGVFDELKEYIDRNSVIIGSTNTVNFLSKIYKNSLFIDGKELIKAIEDNQDIKKHISNINELIAGKKKIILACTHFLRLEENVFIIKEIRNKKIPFY